MWYLPGMEAEVLGEALDSLRAQQFDGEIQIFVVDDNSSDATSEIASSRGALCCKRGRCLQGGQASYGRCRKEYPLQCVGSSTIFC